MIVLQGVSKDYGEGKVLDGISLQIEPGEFVCVTGSSGAGKTTLLSLLIGAEPATGGIITVDGVSLRKVPPGALQIFRRRLGIVFQDYKLLANRTVAENVSFPLEVCGASDETIRQTVPDLLKRMSLTSRANALPRELSGGEKARTAIARAIAHKPLILLADEPTQNLDPDQAKDVLQTFRDINAGGTTVIIATHDAVLVDLLRTRVIQLEKGRIIRDSVGGYRSAATAPVLIKEPEKEPEPIAVQEKESVPTKPEAAEEVPHPKKAHTTHAKHAPAKHSRKVKVTAIHSE